MNRVNNVFWYHRNWQQYVLVLLLSVSVALCSVQPQAILVYTDPRTQISWQRCSAGMRLEDGRCAGVPALYNWQQALQFCAQLPAEQGYTWHLPDRDELLGLIDWQQRTPAVPEALQDATKNNVYWSATTSVDEPDKAFYVSMFSGYSYPNKKIIQGFVRCVKSAA